MALLFQPCLGDDCMMQCSIVFADGSYFRRAFALLQKVADQHRTILLKQGRECVSAMMVILR
jgi:hypothetical protein